MTRHSEKSGIKKYSLCHWDKPHPFSVESRTPVYIDSRVAKLQMFLDMPAARSGIKALTSRKQLPLEIKLRYGAKPLYHFVNGVVVLDRTNQLEGEL